MKAIIFAESKELKSTAQNMKNLRRDLRLNSIKAEDVDINSPDGSQRAELYGAMSFPALVLIREDGAVQDIWQGDLPDYNSISQSIGHI